MTRVAHIVGGVLHGGAARGAYWLHQGLRELGVESTLLVPDRKASGPGVCSVADSLFGDLAAKVRWRVDQLPVKLYRHRTAWLFSPAVVGYAFDRHPAVRAADLVHLHWINGGTVAMSAFPLFGKPIVWTLRDWWPMTGGCHVPLDCDGYTRGCGACPGLCSDDPEDLSFRVMQRKRDYLPEDLVVVGNSSHITDCARRSTLLGNHRIFTINNCVDTDSFAPLPRDEARARLGLPADRRIVLTGMQDADSRHKGGDLMLAAAARLGDLDPLFCCFGAQDRVPDGWHAFGHVGDDARLRQIYAAADVYVFPSRQESFGKTAAEALACGTAAVAFNSTGPMDIVRHRETGYLARPYEADDLAAGIRWVLDEPGRAKALGRAGAADVRARFAAPVIAGQYKALYEDILTGKGG